MFVISGCDRGVKADIFADDNGQVFTGSQSGMELMQSTSKVSYSFQEKQLKRHKNSTYQQTD